MPVPFNQEALSSVSTHSEKALLRAQNMDNFTTTLGDAWVNPLDPRIVNILDAFYGNTELYVYVAGKAITTVSFELYDTTSAWWIILYLNGYMHPDEISDGATLNVPTVAAMNVLLQSTAKTNRGQQITI